MKLTEEGRAKGLKGAVGMVYDTLARKQWAEYSYNAVEDFDLSTASLSLDTELRSQAESEAGRYNDLADKGGGKGSKGGHGSSSWNGKGSSSSSWGAIYQNNRGYDNDTAGEKRKLPWDKGYGDQKRHKGGSGKGGRK